MQPPQSRIITLPLVALAALSLPACDQGVGVHELILRTTPGGEELEPMASCVLSSRNGDSVAGGGGGPDFATEVVSKNGQVLYRYYIAAEIDVGTGHVTPANGELAAEIEADMEFFESGELEQVAFETYDGIAFEVYLWGEDDCEGDLPTEPPM